MVIDLNTTLTDTDKMLSRLIGERVRLITQPAGQPVYVMADSVQLGQVLMNLAVNARDAMPNGGKVLITTSVVAVQRLRGIGHTSQASNAASVASSRPPSMKSVARGLNRITSAIQSSPVSPASKTPSSTYRAISWARINMHSIFGSSMAGKYDRLLTVI